MNDKFIGTTVAKKITVNILNPDNSINIENKTIQAFVGIYINGELEEIPYGTYIIEKPDNEEVKQKTSFTGYDYMIKFNPTYKDRVTYPIKASALFEDVCNQVGLEVGNLDFINANYMILGNPFTNNEDCRTVLSNIAQLAGGFAKIGRDNKVYIISLKNLSDLLTVKDVHFMTVQELNLIPVKRLSSYSGNSDEKLDGNNYFEDFSKNEQWGEVNSLVLSISNIEGENSARDDKESIETNGLTEITIADNYFLIDQAEREKVIEPLWNSLKGIKYLPFKTKYYGYPYLDTGDLIYIEDTKDTGYISYVFNHTFTFNGSFSGEINTPAMTKTQTAYKNTNDIKTRFKQAERKINKIDGEIEDIIEEQTETSQKLTQHEQTIDEIKDTVSNIQNVTNTLEGNKTVILDNCVEGNLLELHIYGNNTVFKHLYPSNDLYPSNELLPYGDSRIEVTNKNNETTTYELGVTDVLRQNGAVCDEYILKDGKAQVIRRINKDGTVKTKEEIEDLGEYAISLNRGTNIITIKNYTARINVKFAIQNDYTDIFATRVEMNAKMQLEAERFDVELSKKTDNNEIIASINMSTEREEDGSQLKLKADKIAFEGAITANGNFKIDTNGNMTARNAILNDVTIKGGNINMVGDSSTPTIEIRDYSNGMLEIYPSNINMTYDYVGDTVSQFLQKKGYYVENETTGQSTSVDYDGIETPSVIQGSSEKIKKNISLYNKDALEIIKNAEIYEYNLKSEEDTDKKHIGFIIGDKYKTPQEVIAKSGEGIDIYTMTTILWKAVQELTKQVEELKGGQAND